jgi:hypothetical protein
MKIAVLLSILLIPVLALAQTEREVVDSLAKRYDAELIYFSSKGLVKNGQPLRLNRDYEQIFEGSPNGLYLYNQYRRKFRSTKVLLISGLTCSFIGLLSIDNPNYNKPAAFVSAGFVLNMAGLIKNVKEQTILDNAIKLRNREVIFGKYGQYNQ